MGIRKHILKSGRPSYEARFRKNGSEINRRFSNKADAVAWLNEQKGSKLKSPTVATIGKAIDFALEKELYKIFSPRWYQAVRLKELFGKYKLIDLNYSVMLCILDKIKSLSGHIDPSRPISDSSARIYYYTLKRTIEHYCDHNDIHINDRTFNVTAPASWSNVRNKRLTDEKVELLVKAMPEENQPFFRDFFFFLLQTACRRQEALGAKFSEFSDGWFEIPAWRNKTRKERRIPYFADLAAMIKRRREQFPDSELLFPDQPSLKKIGLMMQNARGDDPGLVLHIFRHEAVCRMVERTDWKEIDIMKITGHERQETFNRYHKLRQTMKLPEGMTRI
jgi:integrase